MSGCVEIYELQVGSELSLVGDAVRLIGIHLSLRGLAAAAWPGIELAVVEGMNNAIKYGCNERADTEIGVRVAWRATTLRIEIRDPGRFVPPAGWGELPLDPLAESGRGGFLMRQAFSTVEHRNDASGHVLVLEKDLACTAADASLALEAHQTALHLATDLETAYETMAGLQYFASLLAKTPNLADLMQRALTRLKELAGFDFAVVRVEQKSGLLMVGGLGLVPGLPKWLGPGLASAELAVFRTGTRQDIMDPRALPDEDPLRSASGPILIVPIGFEASRIGTLVVARREKEPFFIAGQVELVHTMAEFLGIAYATGQLQEKQRDMEVTQHDLLIAAAMQQRLLPATFPVRTELRLAGRCLSAQAVGGDYFDVIDLGAQGMLLVVADVMGKGLPAALISTVLRSAIRAREGLASDPGALLTAVNRQLSGDLLALDVFITAMLGYLPGGARELRLASAGHCPLFVRRANNTVERHEGNGCPLGVIENFAYETSALALQPGDLAVLLTDGLYEFDKSSGGQLGLSGLESALREAPGDVEGLVTHLMNLSAPKGDRPASDDRTLLVVERLP
jgi:serine phosphatase RsbU (regulator of sigma subunit)/anti-sigma regulatory factor (Ser/Thr protein kinase)